MKDTMRVHVLYHPGSAEGARLAELVKSVLHPHLAGSTLSPRISVRRVVRPGMTEESGMLQLSDAMLNAVILLDDFALSTEGLDWDGFLSDLVFRAEHDRALRLIPFADTDGERAAPVPAPIHAIQRVRWRERHTDEADDTRFLLHVVTALRELLGQRSPHGEREKLFVSFAGRDGRAWAEDVVDFVNGSRFDVDIPVFYDAKSLRAGERYDERFEAELRDATLLALMTDSYDASAWCNKEMLIAKQGRRPIVVADLNRTASPRTFPYGANVPMVRCEPTRESQQWIARLLLAAHIEGLRCDLFRQKAGTEAHYLYGDRAEVLPRPPELLDLVGLAATGTELVLYPEPPLNEHERSVLDGAMRAMDWRAELQSF